MNRRPIQSVSLALAALTVAVVYCDSAQALETRHIRATAGQTTKLAGWTVQSGDYGCVDTPPANVTMLSPPHGGTTAQRINHRLPSSSRDVEGTPHGCDGFRGYYRDTYYTARVDFSGEDRVTLRLHGSQRDYDYLFIIQVDPGKQRPAAAASTRPQQNDVNSRNPAATNAGDFFANVEKNATPTAANKPAPTPAGTNAGDFFSQVPTQPEQPRSSQNPAQSRSSTPPASNSSPPQGLGQ